jgi:5-methylcytosine-specific restriction protein A
MEMPMTTTTETKERPAPAPSLREIVWARGGRKCDRCERSLDNKSACNLDPIDLTQASRRGPSKKLSNLRCLCRKCFVLRCGPKGIARPAGVIDRAIADGVVPPDWRPLVWEG